MMRRGTRRVPMFIEKAGTISSTPKGSYVFVEIVFKNVPFGISRVSEVESRFKFLFETIYFIFVYENIPVRSTCPSVGLGL
jgi:hypothetical protein